MKILKKILELKDQYNMCIPSDYIEFIKDTQFFDYSGSVIKSGKFEIELNHFLTVDSENPSRDVLDWYGFAKDERIDYLTIAMGPWNEEFAIKVYGDNLGSIYYIDQNDDENIIIEKLFDNFKEFKDQLKPAKWD